MSAGTPAAFLGIAQCQEMLGKYSEAGEALISAEQLLPFHPDILIAPLQRVQADRGNAEAAVATFTLFGCAALRDYSEIPGVAVQVAKLCVVLGKTKMRQTPLYLS